ncbi:diguanylate cyclase [Aestuariirhabdus sp. Z084]|uniref:diguanylate cyclase domain-containing protein n=1 Tax=Aestuariirhabdus haliotis TaxID=2918751 RepID=UPI00201B44A0|nr:diguanylate cyclase [Aestuariirhabdus haliotis]MCL6414490.1 diguanylate cyclase [Aestuariirhabdus haliotis]MCL6418528.1 diguanylate cyclase [Aestuariirhabdus haliotis]
MISAPFLLRLDLRPLYALIIGAIVLLPGLVTAAPLQVAIVTDDAPYSLVTSDGTAQGLLVDLWRYWGRINNREINFVHSSSYSQAVGKVLTGKANVIAGLNSTNPAHAQLVETEFALEDPDHLFTHLSLGEINNWDAVRPYRIGIDKQSSSIATELRNSGLAITEYESLNAMLQAAETGSVKVIAGPLIAGNYVLKGHLQASLFQLNSTLTLNNGKRMAMISAGNPALLDEINQGFQRLHPSRIRSIIRAWGGILKMDNSLIVTLPSGMPPYSTVAADGSAIGLLPDIWRLWSTKTNTSVRFLMMDPQQNLQIVSRGLADIIGATLTPLPEYTNRLSYPAALLPVKFGVYVPQSSQASTISDLGAATIIDHNIPHLRRALLSINPDLNFISNEHADLTDSDNNAAILESTVIMTHPTNPRTANNAEYRLLSGSLLDEMILVALPSREEKRALLIQQGMEKITDTEFAELEDRWIPNPQDHFYSSEESQIPLSPNDQKWLQNNPVVRIGILEKQGSLPYDTEYNRELLQLLEKYLPVRFEARFYTSQKNLIEALTNNDVDLINHDLDNIEDVNGILFSSVYKSTPWVIATRDSQIAIKDLRSLEGKTIAAISGSSVIRQLTSQAGLRVIEVDSMQEGIDGISSGRIHGYAGNLTALAQHLKAIERDNILLHRIPELKDEEMRFAIRNDWLELRHLLNQLISNLGEDELKALKDKWLSIRLEFGINESDLWIARLKIISIAALVVILILLWNHRLRQEIRRRIAAEEEVRHLATHDNLTGLPNRRLLWDRIEQALESARRNQHKAALFFIDLDGFKSVNDTLGHEAGDQLLIEVAARINSTLRDSDTIARIGGDEFVVLLPALNNSKGVAQVAENLLSCIKKPYPFAKDSKIGASIGIAIFPDNADNPEELMTLADDQMYKVKKAGKNHFAFA